MNEIIQDALANDNDFEPIYSPPSNKEISRLNESAFCEDPIKKFPPDNDTIDLLLTRWSDDFEPYNVKQNKGNSIWVFSVTIYTKHDKKHSSDNTYIVSMGLKNDDHDPIEKLFVEELNNINNDSSLQYYRKGKKRPVRVRVHLVASICDLPERYSRCYITRGNGNHTSRWGYLCDINKMRNHLSPCKLCSNELKTHLQNEDYSSFSTSCDVCTCWSMDNQHLLSTDVPQKIYDHNTNTDKRLPVRKSRFSELQKALMFCYHKLKRGEWSSAEGSIYLSMYGINNKLQSSIIINGENEFNLAQILQLPNYENSSDYLKLLDDRTLNPNMFGTPSIPPSWDIPNGISSYIDAPMHLIF